ncbi:MAG TPA: hypothetical protein VFJ19_12785 [Nocardioidaceae bacterium]|nr:hypothetical protein [Nocardioidaceae bacterium]
MTLSTTRRRRLSAVLASAAILVAPLGVAAAATSATADDHDTHHGEVRPYEPGPDEGGGPDAHVPKGNGPSRVPAAHVPQVDALPVTGAASGVRARIDGLTMKDQRLSNGGNSFSIEPPDQGLCTGNGYVIEAVNNVFAVYKGGSMVGGPQSLDPFWNNGTAEIDRSNAPDYVYGPFISDPKCYYDPALDRFFMTELQLSVDPATGAFTGHSSERIAVSKTSTPSTDSSDWYLYSLDTTNNGKGGTPKHTGCPCFGDQPLIGADRYGFYVSTNEFSILGPNFNGAQIYAFDKTALAQAYTKRDKRRNGLHVQRIESNGTPLEEGTAYSVQPATSPTADQWSDAANGTEYFLSSLEFTGGLDNRIATWALTNTASLTTDSPDAHLSYGVVHSEVYGEVPEGVAQKAGPTPQADALKTDEEEIAANDDRMNQVVFADGQLWSGLNTAVRTPTGPTTVGIAYFVVTPSVTPQGMAQGTMANQGYVAPQGDQNSVIFPSIGVTPGGSAVMVFTLTGLDYYPSAAMVHLDPTGRLTSDIEVLAAGAVPDDGFTGYPAYAGDGVGRWGDYSAAVADGSGNVWVATEYIPGTFGYPEFIANWGTYLAQVAP